MCFRLLSLVCPALAATSSYFIRHVPSGYCLDVWGFPGLEIDTPASLWECEFGRAGSDHAWVFQDGLIRNQMNGLCLDVAGSNAANEATVQVDACLTLEARSGTPTDQTWNLQPAREDNGTYLINGAAPGRCLTVWAEDFIPGAWIVNQDCEFNRSNRTSQLWELIEVCKLENSNAYNQTCPPTCKRSEYIQDNQCVPCPTGQFAEDNECRSCLPGQFWDILEEACDYCPDGKEVADDMLSCEDETFLGLTEIQWAAIGTALAACSLLAGAFLTLRRCCKTDGDKRTPIASQTTSEIPVVQAVQLGSTPVSEGSSRPNKVVVDGSGMSTAAASPATLSDSYAQDFQEDLAEINL